MDNKKKKVIHRRKWLTLEEKLRIIELNESGKTSTRIARELGMNESSVRSILRKKDFYKALGNTKSLYRFKSFARCRSLVLDKMEKQLTAWIEDQNLKGVQLTETDIQRKALALFNELKPEGDSSEKFSASRGWFYRFKNRIDLQNCIMAGEKQPLDRATVEAFQQEFARLIEEGRYTHHQIFNVEETCLYWKKVPSQSFLLDDNLQGYKPCNEILTLYLGGNAAGDLKLKPLVVYRSETPSALRDCNKDSLPVIWRSNKKAWLSKELVQEWFDDYFWPTVETYCLTRGLEPKILLLLDSGRREDSLDFNENIQVVYMAENLESTLQPMTLGIFPILKANYLRKILFQAISSTADMPLQEFWSRYNIKKAVENIYQCWCDTSPEDMAASWHQLLADVKVKDFASEVGVMVQEVVAMGQCLGLKAMDVQKVQHCIDLTLADCDSSVAEFEEVICKEEVVELVEEEEINSEVEPSASELEKIIGSIDLACETIVGCDPNVERSIKVRQMLQNGIQTYRELYLARTK